MPTERELEQMRDANMKAALAGEDVSAAAAVYDLVTGAVSGPESED